ncbi:hypothetical protein ONZ45_g8541 [Pleurotus djamor]|nr:hypothetical protein ONZ45_g8541 [Pleurotus djamor]
MCKVKLNNFAAQKLIDDEIRELETTIIAERETQILALKRRRNTYCAVSQIPPTLLSSIFLETRGNALSPTYDPTWHRLNLVCSHWRAVALNSPLLWTNIRINYAKLLPRAENWTLKKLNRAGMAPLVVTYDISSIGSVDPCSSIVTTTILSKNLSNLTVVSANLKSIHDFLHLVLRNDSQAVNSLCTLRLWGLVYKGQLKSLGDCVEIPHLRHLTLEDLAAPPTFPVFPRLTHVHLLGSSAHIRVSQLLQMLSTSPMMEEIEIDKFEDTDNTAIVFSPIPLPHLKSIAVTFDRSSTSSTASRLFETLQLPVSSSVKATFHCRPHKDDNNDQDARYIASLFAQWIHQFPSDYETLEINHCKYILSSPMRNLSIRLPISTANTDVLETLPLCVFSTLIINTIHMSTHNERNILSTVQPILNSLVNLETLSLNTFHGKGRLLSSLEVHPRDSSSNGCGIPNPKLKTLQGNFTTKNIRKLEKVINGRRELGFPIEWVCFKGSCGDGDASKLDRLTTLVYC